MLEAKFFKFFLPTNISKIDLKKKLFLYNMVVGFVAPTD